MPVKPSKGSIEPVCGRILLSSLLARAAGFVSVPGSGEWVAARGGVLPEDEDPLELLDPCGGVLPLESLLLLPFALELGLLDPVVLLELELLESLCGVEFIEPDAFGC